MATTDPIADLLTRVRNGARARKEFIDCPWSKIKERLVRVLIEEGYLAECSVIDTDGKKDLRVWIRYDAAHQPVLTGIRRISKPSLRVYVGSRSMPRVRGGLGVNILSTPAGILVDREATRQKVGGELLCSVW
jgi:small subunit ribosomal protein S8